MAKKSTKKKKSVQSAPKAKAKATVAETKSKVDFEFSDASDSSASEASFAGVGESGGMVVTNAAGAAETISSASLKNFRHHPDIENFYRFVHDNDLRYEALEILEETLLAKQNKRKIKAQKAKAH